MSYKGLFKPNNPKKYLGDPTNIVYRSSWELRVFSYLDSHPDVINWSSEEIIIPYVSPVDNRIHRYFPDIFVRKRGRSGKIEEALYEIKPDHETRPPKNSNKKSKKFYNEVMKYAINQKKWEAAKEYCHKRGWTFHILTENDIPTAKSVNRK